VWWNICIHVIVFNSRREFYSWLILNFSEFSAKKVKIVFFCIIPPGVKDAYVVLHSHRSFPGNHNQCSRPLSRQQFGRILSLRQPSRNRILPPKRNPVLPIHQRNWCRFHVGQRRFEASFLLQGYTSSSANPKLIGNPWRAIPQRSFLKPRFIIIWRISKELIFLTGQVVREIFNEILGSESNVKVYNCET
jgi:hypothetical protein